MKWTTKQKEAIDTRGKNILVAAAAGSGKTAVLVERIKKLILDDGVSIDKMLIVTFTNAAAAEMKEKIRKAIYDEIDANPDNAAKLREQLNLLPNANISTFHAFALEVIRTYFYKADIEPNFSICDGAQSTLLKEDSMDLLMAQCFDEGSPEFYQFLDWYSSDRNQKAVRDIILNSYTTLQALPYPWKWLDNKVKNLKMTPAEFVKSDTMAYVEKYTADELKKACSSIKAAADELDVEGLSRLSEKLYSEDLAKLQKVMENLENGESILEQEKAFRAYKPASLRASKEEKETYDAVKEHVAALRKKGKDSIEKIRSLILDRTIDSIVKELNETAPLAETLQKLILEFHNIFSSAKAAKNLVDFNDIEHFALSILEDEQVCRSYREKFEHIFIDEYQDTNILQEEIISKIKRENNLFMVGDIKQSIYKFRLAEPEIFKSKYQAYKTDPESVKIDLNQNFRSKDVILDEINHTFENVMEDYDKAAMLYPGVTYTGPYMYNPETIVIDTKTREYADPEIQSLETAEIEALEVMNIINDNIGKPFFDHKAGINRVLQKKDIVILMRGTKNYADIFYQTLKDNDIESFVDDSSGYFDTMEINVFMNLISVIDNKRQDVELISVLHSEIFGFSSRQLAKIRAQFKNGSFAEALVAYSEKGESKSLKDKCKGVLESLKKWKEQAQTMPLGKFLWSLLLETGYYLMMGAMPGGAQRQANLRVLIDKAESFTNDRQVSLYGFVRYINIVKEKNVAVGQVKLIGENDDVVRIMTIHKSKGLEFPMVIICGMGKRLTYKKTTTGVSLHKDIGIGMTLVNPKEHWHKRTLIENLIANRVHQEEVDEEKRVLYVAMTRAKDVLYMTGTVRDGKKYLEDKELEISGDTSYYSMINYAGSRNMMSVADIDPGDNRAREHRGIISYDFLSARTAKADEEEINRRLNYVYPYEDEGKVKSKYSVSEINSMGKDFKDMEYDIPLAVPKFTETEHKLTAAEKGTIYHKIMEFIDFRKAERDGKEYIREALDNMVEREILFKEELDHIHGEDVLQFFDTDMGKRCAAAYEKGMVAREKPFTLKTDLDGREILVQGIIDCFFEEDDGFVLIDYKTNWIDFGKIEEEEERLRNMYSKQIEIYKEAIEKAHGKKVKEAYLYVIGAGRTIKMEQ